jgi:hypothetical protein
LRLPFLESGAPCTATTALRQAARAALSRDNLSRALHSCVTFAWRQVTTATSISQAVEAFCVPASAPSAVGYCWG